MLGCNLCFGSHGLDAVCISCRFRQRLSAPPPDFSCACIPAIPSCGHVSAPGDYCGIVSRSVFVKAACRNSDRGIRRRAEHHSLATIGGSALVDPASPLTVRGRAPLRPEVHPLVPVGAQFQILATAYLSTPDQTDASPFITASGTHVHDGTVATNFLPFGTRVRFHNYRPDMIFTVEDRHSPRLSDRVDSWFASRGEALRFGKRVLEMEIVE